jgi:hypothetical protein
MAVLGQGGAKAPTEILEGKSMLSYNANLSQIFGIRNAYAAANTPTNVINITGSGVLSFGAYGASTDSTTTATVKMTFDGVDAINETRTGALMSQYPIQVGGGAWSPSQDIGSLAFEPLPFYSSLVVTLTADRDVYYYYEYYLT